MSKIEWTEETWNPLIGCSKVSPGCKNCYAIQMAWIRMHNPKMAERYAGVVEKTAGGALNWTGKVNVVKEAHNKPLLKKKPTMYFVNSMSDLFHEAVPFSVIHDIFDTIAACPQHTFQILTKRPARLLEYVKWFQRGGRYAFAFPNVWLGVSVENQQTADERIPLLLQVPAAVRFLSCEPLLGPVNLFYDDEGVLRGPAVVVSGGVSNSTVDSAPEGYDDSYPGIDWVIVGGESGHGARPMHPEWVRSLRDQCDKAGTAFFFKQQGDYLCFSGVVPEEYAHIKNKKVIEGGLMAVRVGKKAAGRLLDGREWNEFPGQPPKEQPAPAEDPDLYFTSPD